MGLFSSSKSDETSAKGALLAEINAKSEKMELKSEILEILKPNCAEFHEQILKQLVTINQLMEINDQILKTNLLPELHKELTNVTSMLLAGNGALSKAHEPLFHYEVKLKQQVSEALVDLVRLKTQYRSM